MIGRLGIICILLLSSNVGNTQSTYFRTVNLFEEDYTSPISIVADSMTFYLSGKTWCVSEAEDSIRCLSLSKHDEFGEMFWGQRFNWCTAANDRSILIRNDTLFVSAHINPGVDYQVYHFLMLDTDGNTIDTTSFYYTTDTLKGVFNNGLVLLDNEVYLYGQSSRADDNNGVCVIQKYNFKTEVDTVFLYAPAFAEYFPGWGMAVDKEQNLVILNEIYRVEPDFSDLKEILKIDRFGNEISRIYSPRIEAINVPDLFLILEDGSYFFLHHVYRDDGWALDVPQLLNTDINGNINWYYDYPDYTYSDTIGNYLFSEVRLARNGDILLVGSRKRRKDLGTGFDMMITRMSPTGEQLWEHYYNTVEDASANKYHHRFCTDIQELADGSLIVVGGSLHERKVVLLRVDANGCLEGYNCDQEIILATEDLVDTAIADAYPEFYPNPSLDKTTLSMDKAITGQYQIFDHRGRLIQTHLLDHQKEIEVNLGPFRLGLYYIHFDTNEGQFVRKVMKF